MKEWALIAGGRCVGSPWRIGIAGLDLGTHQKFILNDNDWSDLRRQLPVDPLTCYGNANGLFFERLAGANADALDSILFVALHHADQAIFNGTSATRQYLLCLDPSGGHAEIAQSGFERVFIPAEKPFNDEHLIFLNQPVDWPIQAASVRPVLRGRAIIQGRDEVLGGDLPHFCLCDTEAAFPGWIPMQWQDCLAAGAVPVHLSNETIPTWFPADCYVDGQAFSDRAQLSAYLDGMTQQQYQALFGRLQNFLTSPESYPYSVDFWINGLTAAIAADVALVRGNMPLLSVVIPTYNYGRFVGLAIQSILDQGLSNIEILVLDNSSADDTSSIVGFFVNEPAVRYMRNRWNIGPSHNVLNGIWIATGRYLSILMADDYYNEGYLSNILALMEANPKTAVGYSPINWVNESGAALQVARHPGYKDHDYIGGRNEVADLLVYDNYITPSTMILRREPFRKTWKHDLGLYGAGDWLTAVQMAESFPDFVFLNTPGVSYRHHGRQHSVEFYSTTAPLADHITIVEGVFKRNKQYLLKGREREIADHLLRRLSLYPGEKDTELGERVQGLCERLNKLARSNNSVIFSIVICSVDESHGLLERTLDAISLQSWRDLEVILLNCHGRAVEHMLNRYEFPISYVRSNNDHVRSVTREDVAGLASGRYVIHVDEGEVCSPDQFDVMVSAHEYSN